MNNENLRLLKEAQEQVICHLVNDKNLYLSHGKRLFPELFKIPELREIYTAYESVFKAGKKPDFISLSKKVSFENGFGYITKLLSKINFNTHFLTSVELLIEQHTKGSLMGIGSSIVTKINNGEESNEIVGFIQTELVNMTKTNHKPIKDMSTHLVEMIKNIEKNMQEQGITGIGTGFRLWDKFSGGLHTSDLFIMAGATSQGKTSLALCVARNAALDYQVPVAIFSLEMSTLQLTTRLASQVSNMNSKDLLRGRLSMDNLKTLNTKIAGLSTAPIYIEDCSSNELGYICNSIRALFIQKGVKLVIVDYLQLVTVNSKGTSEEQKLADIARTFKNLAKELDICVMALCQMNRGKDSRGNGSEPKLSDLRGSGQIEEAADVVMFVYRPEYYGITQDESGNSLEGKADLIIAKGRSIGTTRIRVNFHNVLTKFSDEEFEKTETGAIITPNANWYNEGGKDEPF